DRIVEVGSMAKLGARARGARRVVDARGAVVAPGFIDVHTHAEGVTRRPAAANFVRQGVTSIVVGNCGHSRFPIGRFLAEVDAVPPAVNVATLVGHGTLRARVLGYAARAPTQGELAWMTARVDEAMRDGAVGLSTGLIYAPGTYASTDEIVALARVAARR